jgi:hypothetical protein
LPFCQLATLSTCHFGNLPLWQLAISSTCHFVNMPFRQLISLSTQHFVNSLFCQLPFHHGYNSFISPLFFLKKGNFKLVIDKIKCLHSGLMPMS